MDVPDVRTPRKPRGQAARDQHGQRVALDHGDIAPTYEPHKPTDRSERGARKPEQSSRVHVLATENRKVGMDYHLGAYTPQPSDQGAVVGQDHGHPVPSA